MRTYAELSELWLVRHWWLRPSVRPDWHDRTACLSELWGSGPRRRGRTTGACETHV